MANANNDPRQAQEHYERSLGKSVKNNPIDLNSEKINKDNSSGDRLVGKVNLIDNCQNSQVNNLSALNLKNAAVDSQIVIQNSTKKLIMPQVFHKLANNEVYTLGDKPESQNQSILPSINKMLMRCNYCNLIQKSN